MGLNSVKFRVTNVSIEHEVMQKDFTWPVRQVRLNSPWP